MNQALFTVLTVSTIALSAGAQPQFTGYVENTTAMYTDDDHTWTDIASARLEGAWEYGDRGGIELHGIVSAALQPLDPFMLMDDSSVTNRIVYGALEGFINTSLGSIDTNSVTWTNINDLMAQFYGMDGGSFDLDAFIRHLPYSTLYPRTSVLLDRAVVKLFFKSVDFFIGRQMIGWGTGYAWNPTDVWNKKNPADPTAPKVGINAIRAEIPLGDLSGLSLVVSPGTALDQTSAGLRCKGNITGYDLSLSATRIHTADAALFGLPERMILGGDLAGQIGNVGVFAELALTNPRKEGQRYTDTDRLYLQTDIGGYYTFENGLYLMAEYYFNRLGADNRNNYSLDHLLYLMNGEMAGMGQHYVFGGMSKEFFRYWTLAINALGNITDHSAMVLPSLEYSHSDNLTVKLGGSIGVGDVRKSEFGGVYSSGMLTVSGYF
ncbi:MAG: hypothetical protein JW863_11440 [Chitinispirillaceae bacterium]|nr:hypothetical protein [Chitinispirillaceae bacterium]